MSDMISRVQVLNGHTGRETAYLVEDYPYSFKLRCKIRYWIETASKGVAKGQRRFMAQTTNPKRPGEVWNTPKASTYSPVAVMYLDEVGHVQVWGAGYHLSPVEDARMRLMGIYDQFTDDDRAAYDALLKRSHCFAQQWHEWEEKIHAIVSHIRETGTDPELDNGVWRKPLMYLGAENLAVYLSVARNRIQEEAAGMTST
ncbi:MAG: hypothetical protein ACRDTZ_05960 [Pseudonocardiaceae bacterium]